VISAKIVRFTLPRPYYSTYWISLTTKNNYQEQTYVKRRSFNFSAGFEQNPWKERRRKKKNQKTRHQQMLLLGLSLKIFGFHKVTGREMTRYVFKADCSRNK